MFILLFLLPLVMASGKCPPNTISLDRNESICYSFHSRLSSFAQARTHCKSFNAELVSLKDEYLNNLIVGAAGLVFDDVIYVWTGGNRFEKTFHWSDGESFGYNRFPKSEEEKSKETCVAVDLQQGFWRIQSCFAPFSYICEFLSGHGIIPEGADILPASISEEDPLTTTPSTNIISSTIETSTKGLHIVGSETTTPPNDLTTTLSVNPPCPPTWKLYSDHCYKFNQENVTWETAEKYCQQNGGHLTSIGDAEENAFIVELILTNHSESYLCVDNERIWIGYQRVGDGDNFTWVDGHEHGYKNWADLYHEPNNLGGNQSCVEILATSKCKFRKGTWNDISCDWFRQFVCKKRTHLPVPEITPTLEPSYEPCPVGWKHNNETNRCYFFSEDFVGWKEAEAECQMLDSHLVTINDETENVFITEFINDNVNNTCVENQTWIGFSRLADNITWLWIDGTNTAYTNWSNFSSQPNNFRGNQLCVQLYALGTKCHFKNGDWNDDDCNVHQRFICEKASAKVATTDKLL